MMGAKLANRICSSYVFLAEAQAAIMALEFTANMGFHSIILEGDSLTIIKQMQLKENENDLSIIWNIMEKARCKADMFNSCKFSHIRREANGAAHYLAKHGRRADNVIIHAKSLDVISA